MEKGARTTLTEENVIQDRVWAQVCQAVPEDEIRSFFKEHIKIVQEAYRGRRMPAFPDIDIAELRQILVDRQDNKNVQAFYAGVLRKWQQVYQQACENVKTTGAEEQLVKLQGLFALAQHLCLTQEQKAAAGRKNQAKALKRERQEWEAEKSRQAKQQEEEKRQWEAQRQAQEAEKATLQQQITASRQKLVALQEKAKAWEDAQEFAYEDATPRLEDAYEEYGGGLLSLMHEDQSYGRTLLYRDADIAWQDGVVTRFQPDPVEWKFAYRRTIISNKIHLKEHYCTLINWYPDQNKDNPGEDYIHSREYVAATYIEVVVLPNCHGLGDVLSQLRAGIPLYDSNCRWAITYLSDAERQEAVLLQRNNFVVSTDGGWQVRPDLCQLPVFELESKHFIPFAKVGTTDRLAYYRLSLGKAKRMAALKSPQEIIKQCVCDAASWKKRLSAGVTRKEWQKLTNELHHVPTITLYERVADACHWPQEQAERAVNAFIQHVDAVALGEDIDSELLCQLALHNEEVIAKCKTLLREDWQKENAEKLANETKKLRQVQDKFDKVSWQLEEARQKRDGLSEKYNEMKQELQAREQLGAQVEQEVKQKLAEVQQNAAQYISRWMVDYPLLQGLSKQPTVQRPEAEAANTVIFEQQAFEVSITEQDPEDAADLVDILQDNLERAGVTDEKIAEALAVLAYACVVDRMPMLFAGAHAVDIVSAISCSLFGELPLLVDLPQSYSAQAMAQLEQSETHVLVLRNIVSASAWFGRLAELTNLPDKQVFIVTPFADDLAIMPRGISAYVLPLMTDLMLDTCKRGNYTFTSAEHLSLFAAEVCDNKVEHTSLRILKGLRMPAFELASYREILALAHGLVSDGHYETMFFLLCGVPYAYLHGELDKYLHSVQEKGDLQKLEKKYRQRLAVLGSDEVMAHV